MPRIRDWKGKTFYRPSPETRFEHIDSLFTAHVDWDLIESMVPELLRVPMSIRSGAILPSDILRRLGSCIDRGWPQGMTPARMLQRLVIAEAIFHGAPIAAIARRLGVSWIEPSSLGQYYCWPLKLT